MLTVLHREKKRFDIRANVKIRLVDSSKPFLVSGLS